MSAEWTFTKPPQYKEVTTLLADPHAISLQTIRSNEKSITLVVRVSQRIAQCPRCQHTSTRVHSHYVRHVADLPWHGVAVRMELHTRRFFCTSEICTQQIFCQRLPSVAVLYACHTARLNDALTFIGFIIGGEAGARLARELGMTASPDTLIRRIRQATLPEVQPPVALGISACQNHRGIDFK